jgi:hypothetical protein
MTATVRPERQVGARADAHRAADRVDRRRDLLGVFVVVPWSSSVEASAGEPRLVGGILRAARAHVQAQRHRRLLVVRDRDDLEPVGSVAPGTTGSSPGGARAAAAGAPTASGTCAAPAPPAEARERETTRRGARLIAALLRPGPAPPGSIRTARHDRQHQPVLGVK